LVKSYETPRASAIAAKVMGPDTVVLSLQNGVGHSAAIHSALGVTHTLLGVTSMAARVMQPGSVLNTGTGPTVLSPAAFALSDAGGAATDVFKAGACPKASLVRDLLVAADLDVRIAGSREQMEGAIYTKLMINSVINPLTALHSIPNGHLLLPAFSPVVAGLTAETYTVLNCCGKLTLHSPFDKVGGKTRLVEPGGGACGVFYKMRNTHLASKRKR
jgi:2-dehydropantoate 2-reductase